MEGFLVRLDVDKAFLSLDHKLLIWSNYLVDRNNFEKIRNHVPLAAEKTKYFELNRGEFQYDVISAYFFIIALEILFLLIKENPCKHF